MLTLDISDSHIRLMMVKRRQVTTAAALPLQPGLIKDGVIIDKAAISQRLTELLETCGIREREAAVSLSGIHSIYRVVSLPPLPKGLLPEAARQEMERAMPVPLAELYTSWQAVPISDTEIVLCLLGTPRNTIDAMIDTLNMAQLKPGRFEIRPLALARVADESDAIIVNVQPTSFDIAVMANGIPELLRSLSFSSPDLPPADKFTELTEELDRTVTFYNSSHKASPLTSSTAVFISGEFGDLLAQHLQYRLKPLPHLLSYTAELDPTEYTANIGLALAQQRADLTPTRVSINVIPEVYLPKPLPLLQIASWAFILAALVILALFGWSTAGTASRTASLQAQVNSLQAQLEARIGTQKALEQLRQQVEQASATLDTFQKPLDSAAQQRAEVNADLATVTSLLPGIIDLESIKYNGSLKINGTAPDHTVVVNYVRDLRNSGQFSEVLISKMEEVEYNVWQFSLTLK